jgi:RNA polymerase sigma-70 factor (ECF subfamily)
VDPGYKDSPLAILAPGTPIPQPAALPADYGPSYGPRLFVRLPELMTQYVERGRFEGWLTRVAIRAALMRSRRERKLVALDLAPVATSTEPASDYAALRLAREAVAALPDALRHVLVLRVMLDHSHAEIAALLGISVGTSEVRLHRAIKQLRAQLGGSC